eukprot:TRINITY_DN7217_c0_g1_i8.p1 TRINITY_DN7217_c0_g1~~TRINITY_DN7217_c0_g1_i8.p1  ORF type:complete len:100 (+),score=46.85 TRINITY_DN7217_c0_g1_i8:1-300(+)
MFRRLFYRKQWYQRRVRGKQWYQRRVRGGGAGAGGGIDDSSGLEGMLEENEVVVERLLVSGLGSELVMRGDDGVSRGDGGSSYEDFVTDDPERLTKEEY